MVKKLIQQRKKKSAFRKDCRYSKYLTMDNKTTAFLCVDTLCFGKYRSIKSSRVYNRSRRVRGVQRIVITPIRHVDTVCTYQMISSTVREKGKF